MSEWSVAAWFLGGAILIISLVGVGIAAIVLWDDYLRSQNRRF